MFVCVFVLIIQRNVPPELLCFNVYERVCVNESNGFVREHLISDLRVLNDEGFVD